LQICKGEKYKSLEKQKISKIKRKIIMTEKKIVIAQTSDLKNGEMKMVHQDDGSEILLIRIDDQFYATNPYCPHYGAPLETGLISNRKIICPWHHATFDVQNGQLCEPPALEGLVNYQLEIRESDIILVSEEKSEHKATYESAKKKQKKDERTFLIIGGGAAGNSAARKLRDLGFKGKIKLISADSHAPYDRTNLSKDFLKGDMDPQWLPLNQEDFYEQNAIEFIKNRKVILLDAQNKEVELDNKTKLKYDKAVVTTGSRPKKLEIAGNDLKNIFTLRSLTDAEGILKRAKDSQKIAIIGASFIGLESAENLKHQDRDIHIIAPESIPFSKLLGEEIGTLIQDKFEANGIKFHLNSTVSEFRGNGKVEEIVLDSGETIGADMVILGIGVQPITDFMPSHDRVVDGSLLTNKYLQVENDIFAAGDVATFPYWKTGDLIRIEHWRVAEQHGMIAASNMLDKRREVEIIPFFWTNLGGLNMRYIGYSNKWDETIIDGDFSAESFIIYYANNNQINAALGVNRDKQIVLIEELLRLGKMPTAGDLKNNMLSFKDLNKLIS
jgi:NADPH-dependent 2,4-dienoyl-CoA reductase/sulfur reductase-like enzyme/nitrite reductase/ring-hydroxylating ferredoxin subunit